MNAPEPIASGAGMKAALMSSADFRESLRRYKPTVYVDGQLIESVADAPALQPGINALGVTYDYALKAELSPLMQATQTATGRTVNRMLHVDESAGDLLNKLEAVRILCQETGCAQRYLMHDALNVTLAKLPDATLVYCGHEYTENNLRFALTLEPGNAALVERMARVRERRAHAAPDWHDATEAEMTVPSTLADERATNPFMRAQSPELQANVRKALPETPPDPVRILGAVRALKDKF